MHVIRNGARFLDGTAGQINGDKLCTAEDESGLGEIVGLGL